MNKYKYKKRTFYFWENVNRSFYFIYLFLREFGISSDCSASKIGWDYLQYSYTCVWCQWSCPGMNGEVCMTHYCWYWCDIFMLQRLMKGSLWAVTDVTFSLFLFFFPAHISQWSLCTVSKMLSQMSCLKVLLITFLIPAS